jgi:nicotinate-nucleotide adenylyltransferase
LTDHQGTSQPRIGMYGGAFDPAHLAHHALAQAAVAQLQLDVLYIVPTGHAWHKTRQLSAPQHRLAMAQLAFADVPAARVDGRETQRAGPTYTLDTLNELQATHPQAQLYLLMGADQFAAFGSWHHWPNIAKIATICIAARAVSTGDRHKNNAQNDVQSQCKMQTVHMPDTPISATDIRQRVKQGLGIDHLVNPSVARYIAQHHLYIS